MVLLLCYHIQYVYEICLAIVNVSSTLRDDLYAVLV